MTLRVNVSAMTLSPGGLSYQWRKDGTDLAGATNNTHAIATVTAASAGVYSVTVSNSAGSNAASITLTVRPPAAPVITTQPRNADHPVGDTAAFTFAATGSFPRTYQWRKDGVPLAGATAAILLLPA